MIRFVIEGDMNTGAVKIDAGGAAVEPRVWRWLLGEALHICERETDKERDKAASDLVIAHRLPNGGPL